MCECWDEIRWTKLKIYAIYSFCKFTALASLLLAWAVTQQEEIDDFYDLQACNYCYYRATEDTSTLYEFGECSTDYYSTTLSNLLTSDSFWSLSVTSSSVSSYLFYGVVAFVCVFLGSFFLSAAVLRYDIQLNNNTFMFQYMYASLVMTALLMGFASIIDLLYFDDGCYVSTVGISYYYAGVVISICVLTVILISCCTPPRFKIWVFWATCVFLGALVIYAEILAIANVAASGEYYAIFYVTFCFVSILEIPVLLYGRHLCHDWGEVLYAQFDEDDHGGDGNIINPGAPDGPINHHNDNFDPYTDL